jgi:hypothetical protein
MEMNGVGQSHWRLDNDLHPSLEFGNPDGEVGE